MVEFRSMSRFVPTLSSVCSWRWCVIFCIFGVTDVCVVLGQDAVARDPALEELRKRIPSGANDDAIIDGWLHGLMDPLVTGTDGSASKSFREAISGVNKASDTTSEFRARLSLRFSAIAKTMLEQEQAMVDSGAMSIVRALVDMDQPGSAMAYVAALKHPASSVRYLGVRGLLSMSDTLNSDAALMRSVIDGVRKSCCGDGGSGGGESNGVVAEWVYRMLSSLSVPESIDAMIAVFQSRIALYRNGQLLVDSAEGSACELLSSSSLSQAQKSLLVRSLAVLLRLDVERYTSRQFPPDERIFVERRVIACESLLERLVSPAKGGDIRGTIQSGEAGLETAIQIELLEWIGDDTSDGVLNEAPWSVAKGAP